MQTESLVWRTTAYENNHGNYDSKDKKKPKYRTQKNGEKEKKRKIDCGSNDKDGNDRANDCKKAIHKNLLGSSGILLTVYDDS